MAWKARRRMNSCLFILAWTQTGKYQCSFSSFLSPLYSAEDTTPITLSVSFPSLLKPFWKPSLIHSQSCISSVTPNPINSKTKLTSRDGDVHCVYFSTALFLYVKICFLRRLEDFISLFNSTKQLFFIYLVTGFHGNDVLSIWNKLKLEHTLAPLSRFTFPINQSTW